MESKTFTFTRTLELDTEMFEDVIDTALEGGIGYWAHKAHHDRIAETLKVYYDGESFEDTDPRSTGVMTIDYTEIGNAIVKVANGDAGAGNWIVEALNQWLNGQPSMDVDLADVIIQVALFDEIIYG